MENSQRMSIAISKSTHPTNPNHQYIVFTQSPPVTFTSQAAAILTRHYLSGIKQPMNKWKTDTRPYTVSYPHHKTKETLVSKNINYKIFIRTLKEKGEFKPEEFNLPESKCVWLDTSIDVDINYHIFDEGSKEALKTVDGTPQQIYGDKFPIAPSLDREGIMYSSFQQELLYRIINNRNALIENSNFCLKRNWLFDLRSLINDAISILDITLIQLYVKAEYLPEPDWNFNPKKMGLRVNRRISDKLKWVCQVTGKPLNIEAEYPKLLRLKKIRNHLNHFDPPTFAFTIEEAVSWLNDIIYIGQILVKIRESLSAPISTALVNFIMQKECLFNPEPAYQKRLPLIEGKAGYTSSIWGAAEASDEKEDFTCQDGNVE